MQDTVFSLRPVDGRLVLMSNVEGRVSCGAGRYWCSDGEQAQFDDYRPRCYFSGRVCVRRNGKFRSFRIGLPTPRTKFEFRVRGLASWIGT